MKRRIAYYTTASTGYYLRSPNSHRYDFYFSTLNQLRSFATDMGWKLKRM